MGLHSTPSRIFGTSNEIKYVSTKYCSVNFTTVRNCKSEQNIWTLETLKESNKTRRSLRAPVRVTVGLNDAVADGDDDGPGEGPLVGEADGHPEGSDDGTLLSGLQSKWLEWTMV